MEQALTAVCKDIRLGKILIQTNLDTGEPEVSPVHLAHGQAPLARLQPAFLPCPAALPAPAQGDQRGLRDPDGQHGVHGGRSHDGRARPAGEGPARVGLGHPPGWLSSHSSVCHRTMMCRRTGSSCCRC